MRCWFAVVLLLAFAAPAHAEPLTVSAAVSLKESLTQIADAYQAESGQSVELNLGASGHLLAQIRDGAPVDVFISAADEQMDQAESQKLIDPATRSAIAGNELVLIVPHGSTIGLQSFPDLSGAKVKRLAIGQPKVVPAGLYAMQVLKHLKLETALGDRIVYGSSVRQVLDYVSRGEVSAGIVYATDARQAGDQVDVIATAESSWHEPIRYVAAAVGASKRADAARAFLKYLSSDAAQKIFAARGFTKPATEPTSPPQTPAPQMPAPTTKSSGASATPHSAGSAVPSAPRALVQCGARATARPD
jgi:molybdate transport system substrate-binding protein